jgi:hypothetical protein
MACALFHLAAARLAGQGALSGDTLRARAPEGWSAFGDLRFEIEALLALTVATLLGAVIAYHPRSRRVADTLAEVQAPRVYLLYAVIGATIGVMVLQYGAAVGFVVFGIGGLIRFRTELEAPPRTGRLILVTLIGLAAGMRLPHLAVLTTAFAYALIHVLDARVTYRIVVKGVPAESVAAAAEAYRAALVAAGCAVVSEKRSVVKAQAALIFRAPHALDRAALERALERGVPRALSGLVDWEAE